MLLSIGKTFVRFHSLKRRTYRQRKKSAKTWCIEDATAVRCAIRHRRCQGCPFNTFFKPEKPTRVNPEK